MGLSTSAISLDGINASSISGSRTEKTNDAFQTVLKSMNQTSLGSESMDSIFEEAASVYGISSNLLKAVAKAESNFNSKAVSKAGAIGVMQLMPATAKALGVMDPYDARQNIMGGAKYLKENLERFGGNVSLALAAYNAGPNSVQKYGGIPPYKETQNYVKTVTSYLNGSPISSGKMVSTDNSLYSLMSNNSSQSAGLSGLYGFGTGGLGSYYGSGTNALSMLLGAATADEDGDTISIDKESFANLIQILRLQMMMNASREVGSLTI